MKKQTVTQSQSKQKLEDIREAIKERNQIEEILQKYRMNIQLLHL